MIAFEVQGSRFSAATRNKDRYSQPDLEPDYEPNHDNMEYQRSVSRPISKMHLFLQMQIQFQFSMPMDQIINILRFKNIPTSRDASARSDNRKKLATQCVRSCDQNTFSYVLGSSVRNSFHFFRISQSQIRNHNDAIIRRPGRRS